MKIYIVDTDEEIVDIFTKKFSSCKNVQVVHDDVINFFNENKDKIDCITSPGNSFGKMTGGFDAAISDILGWDFQLEVQKYIKDNFYGEQPIGTSFIIKTPINNLSLIHTPTMRVPSIIHNTFIVYQCMRTTLMCALENNIKNIIIPVFGGACGQVKPEVAAEKMYKGYLQIFKK